MLIWDTADGKFIRDNISHKRNAKVASFEKIHTATAEIEIKNILRTNKQTELTSNTVERGEITKRLKCGYIHSLAHTHTRVMAFDCVRILCEALSQCRHIR